MRSLISRRPLVGVLALLAFSLISWGCDGSGENDEVRGSRPIPLSFTDNNNGTITDNITSLMWQKDCGESGEIYTWDEAVGSTEIGVCEELELGGHLDWRVASVQELLSIVVYERIEPAIDTTYFPETVSANYWTATELSGDPDQVYRIDFATGRNKAERKEQKKYFVRCVRGAGLPDSSFIDNTDGTITDRTTGLVWQQDTGPNLPWEGCIRHCRDLTLAGHEDWRLPTIRELITLVDYTSNAPRIKTSYFPNTHFSMTSDGYSASTKGPGYSGGMSWFVGFFWGGSQLAGGTGWARCVRDE